jgi:hypothetical protein
MSTGTPPLAPQPAAQPHKPAVWPAIVTGLLFVGWIGYLAYLVLELQSGPGGTPMVLSRPQFLVSELDVVTELDDDSGKAVVKEVLFPKTAESSELVGQTIQVTNLKDCKPFPRERQKESDGPSDFTRPGLYILPLRSPTGEKQVQKLNYEVVPTPGSPGYPVKRKSTNAAGPPRIYPANKEALAQYRQIAKPQ